ncbi:MAG TPA: 16S rRNA (cytosine(1402)-N(4))-methyltransferase RsmH [Anaerolineales bacterium]|nr:16S rRNA (cytosine(1402)-N(4))-methyltransferase RsmH [Anaerolineales bacterium]HRF49814.1 16S rRNA (cytosine(1402)-N(4))-methyltransferase RsmH [Anaerolineales bacterium]
MTHVPVLYNEVLDGLNLRPGGLYIDGTVGAGGHAAGILERTGPDGRLIGFDRDLAALATANERLAVFGDRVRLIHVPYTALAEHVAAGSARGMVLDLGLSSLQMDDPERGFAFRHDGPLDMRFDPSEGLTAAEVVNTWPVDELADALYEYGEERLSRRIARAIVEARPVQTTAQLAEVIARATGKYRERIHPATRTFQALRIVVNDELGQVAEVLPLAVQALASGGRLAVITFHSLEDRIVKRFFRQAAGMVGEDANVSSPTLRIVNKKVIEPTAAEIETNPRSRSAKLRLIERL